MIFLRRKPTVIQFIGFIFGTLGVSTTVLVGSGGIHSINLGDMNILLSITSQALSVILIKRASETMDPRLLTGYMLLIGSFFLFLISLWKEPGGLDSLVGVSPSVWAVYLFSAGCASGGGRLDDHYGIGHVGRDEKANSSRLITS